MMLPKFVHLIWVNETDNIVHGKPSDSSNVVSGIPTDVAKICASYL